MKKLAILIAFCFILSGCFTENKVLRQTDKMMSSKYALTAAERMRIKYPCVTTAVDSTKFLQSIDTLKRLLKSSQEETTNHKNRVKVITDSLNSRYTSKSETLEGQLNDCSEALQSVFTAAAVAQDKAERLAKDSVRTHKALAQALEAIDQIQPVQQTVKDSVDGAKAAVELTKALEKAGHYEELYNTDHEWRLQKERRESGNLVLYIPWKLIITLLVIAGILLYLIKFQGFNPLAILKRKNKVT